MTNRTPKGNPPVFTRMEPEDRADAQAMADAEYDGNLSLLVRIAVKQIVADWKRRRAEGAAA